MVLFVACQLECHDVYQNRGGRASGPEGKLVREKMFKLRLVEKRIDNKPDELLFQQSR